MKLKLIVFLNIMLLFSLNAFSQKSKYSTTIIEFPFTWSNAAANGVDVTGPVRFMPFFNVQNNVNIDFNDNVGFFAGLAVHNVGFKYNVNSSTLKKVRSYNLGIPVGLKFGKMDNSYFYAGYEIEFPFSYKETTIINEEKSKFTKWWSDRTQLQQSFLVGVQLPQGMNVKFKYYFTQFYNEDYSELNDVGATIYPYQNFNANVYWVSLNIVLFRNTDFTY